MKLNPITPRRSFRDPALLFLCMLLPLMMAGCPEFGNDVVNALDAATRSVVNSAIDLLYDQFRGDNVQ